MSSASIHINERDRLVIGTHTANLPCRTAPYLSVEADGVSLALFIGIEQIEQLEAGLAALRMEHAAEEARKADARAAA